MMSVKDNAQRSPFGIPETLLLISFALLLFLFNLGRGLYNDEYLTWMTVTMTYDQLLLDRLNAGHMPVWFLFMATWSELLGDTELFLRVPSVIFAVGAVVGMRSLAWELFRSATTARITALIFTIHQLTVWAAQTARPHATVLFWSILSTLCFLRWWREEKHRWLIAMIATSTISVAMLPVMIIVPIGFFLTSTYLISRERYRPKARIALISLGTFLFVLGIIGAALKGVARTPNVKNSWSLPIGRLFEGFGDMFLGDFIFQVRGDFFTFLSLFIGALCIAGLYFTARLRGRVTTEEKIASVNAGAVVIPWILMGMLILFVGQAAGNSVLSHARYWVPILPPLVLLLAGGLQGLALAGASLMGEHRARLIPVPIMLLMAVYTLGWLKQDGDGPAQFARAHPNPQYIAGNAWPLKYEYRNTMVNFLQDSFAGDEDFTEWASELPEEMETFWLTIYNNKHDPHDSLLLMALDGWEVEQRVQYAHLRAVQFRRKDG